MGTIQIKKKSKRIFEIGDQVAYYFYFYFDKENHTVASICQRPRTYLKIRMITMMKNLLNMKYHKCLQSTADLYNNKQ